MRKLLTALVVSAIAVGYAFPITGDDILKKVEDTLTAPKDTYAEATMLLMNDDGSGKEQRKLVMWTAGKKKRLIKFKSPAGVRGVGLLVLGDDRMYLYLPSMRKIRRIESSAKNESFQGTDFSYNEISSYEYRKHYTAKLIKETAKEFVLELTRKKGSDREYDKLIMYVRKSNYVPSKVELYKKGALRKVMLIPEVKKKGKYWTPTKITMHDVVKKHKTIMTLKRIKFDQGLVRKKIFTKRFLKRRVR